MKKQMYGIIGLSAAVVVLGGGLAVLKVTDKSGNDSSSSVTATESAVAPGADLVLIEDGDKAPGTHTLEEEHYHGVVKSVKVVNEFGTMEAVLEKEASEGESSVYTIKGCEDLPLDNSVVVYSIELVDTIDISQKSQIFEKQSSTPHLIFTYDSLSSSK